MWTSRSSGPRRVLFGPWDSGEDPASSIALPELICAPTQGAQFVLDDRGAIWKRAEYLLEPAPSAAADGYVFQEGGCSRIMSVAAELAAMASARPPGPPGDSGWAGRP